MTLLLLLLLLVCVSGWCIMMLCCCVVDIGRIISIRIGMMRGFVSDWWWRLLIWSGKGTEREN